MKEKILSLFRVSCLFFDPLSFEKQNDLQKKPGQDFDDYDSELKERRGKDSTLYNFRSGCKLQQQQLVLISRKRPVDD